MLLNSTGMYSLIFGPCRDEKSEEDWKKKDEERKRKERRRQRLWNEEIQEQTMDIKQTCRFDRS